MTERLKARTSQMCFNFFQGIERKVDKLVAQAKAEERSNLIAEKAAAKCQAPTTVLEALLQDVASKVDVIFDRLPEEVRALNNIDSIYYKLSICFNLQSNLKSLKINYLFLNFNIFLSWFDCLS
jgi:hypothetical protein